MAESQGALTKASIAQHEKIYCTNCIHCKLVRTSNGSGNQYYLRQANLEDVFLKATGRGLNAKQ